MVARGSGAIGDLWLSFGVSGTSPTTSLSWTWPGAAVAIDDGFKSWTADATCPPLGT